MSESESTAVIPGSSWPLLWNEYYNTDDTYVPLYMPLSFWVMSYALACKFNVILPSKEKFHDWAVTYHLYVFGSIALGLLSIYYNDDNVLNERVVVLWTFAYHVVDIVDCLLRMDTSEAIIALLILLWSILNITSPISLHLRIHSKSQICECSSPLLRLSRRTHDPMHLILFTVVLTLCRVVWIPFMIHELRYEGGMEWSEPHVIALGLFYMMNLLTWTRITRTYIKVAKRRFGSTEESTNAKTTEEGAKNKARKNKKKI